VTDDILIRGGHVTTCDPSQGDFPSGDVLVREGRIAAVGRDLKASAATVIDARGRLVIPGLVDTHRHVWQGALGAATPQVSLMGYIGAVIGGLAPHFGPEDIYAGTLWGALQALHAGITTLVDWSHNLATFAHAEANLRALDDSGIRGWLLYGGPSTDQPHSDATRQLRELFSERAPARLSLGLAIPGPAFSSIEDTAAEVALARELSLPISLHVGMSGFAGAVEAMHAHGLLGPDVNYAHANQLTADEFDAIGASGGSVSLCPSIDMLMALGTYPATGQVLARGIPAGLSVDTTTGTGSDLFSEMRIALAAERSRANAAAVSRDEAVPEVALGPRDMLDLVTLQAAKVWRMDHEIGSLTPGKRADVTVVDLRPVHLDGFDDPVATAVFGAGPADVEIVLVGGAIVKADGRLRTDLDAARALMRASRETVRGRARAVTAA
jgi:5-methylthioadenosine/S-adenosylhomocysteine deaminase